MFDIEAGRTYFDDGTTIFDVYIEAGIADGTFEPTKRRRDTIVVSYGS
ncbi:hypothetical protein RB623_00130 [Mesorhizobium sp. LHD-90]|nr:hypothetical protein [Mesorhizobium sp. LHD-90]MDQ6432456.1 hypothetical protein [Mesorhizobium sp. LHD-90]